MSACRCWWPRRPPRASRPLRLTRAACSLVGPQPHIVDPAMQASDQVPPALPVPLPARIKRGEPAQQTGCGAQVSSCDDLGIIYITAQATDDMTPPEKIGYRLSLGERRVAPGLTLPPTRSSRASRATICCCTGPDGADQPPFAFTVRIVAIDLAGNESHRSCMLIADEPAGHAACAVARGRDSRPGSPGSRRWPCCCWRPVAGVAPAKPGPPPASPRT
jgi:hypothetical protein